MSLFPQVARCGQHVVDARRPRGSVSIASRRFHLSIAVFCRPFSPVGLRSLLPAALGRPSWPRRSVLLMPVVEKCPFVRSIMRLYCQSAPRWLAVQTWRSAGQLPEEKAAHRRNPGRRGDPLLLPPAVLRRRLLLWDRRPATAIHRRDACEPAGRRQLPSADHGRRATTLPPGHRPVRAAGRRGRRAFPEDHAAGGQVPVEPRQERAGEAHISRLSALPATKVTLRFVRSVQQCVLVHATLCPPSLACTCPAHVRPRDWRRCDADLDADTAAASPGGRLASAASARTTSACWEGLAGAAVA